MPTLIDMWTTPIWLAQTALPLHHKAIHTALSTPNGQALATISADTVLADLTAVENEFRDATGR